MPERPFIHNTLIWYYEQARRVRVRVYKTNKGVNQDEKGSPMDV